MVKFGEIISFDLLMSYSFERINEDSRYLIITNDEKEATNIVNFNLIKYKIKGYLPDLIDYTNTFDINHLLHFARDLNTYIFFYNYTFNEDTNKQFMSVVDILDPPNIVLRYPNFTNITIKWGYYTLFNNKFESFLSEI